MPLNQPSGSHIKDLSITQRDLAKLPILSVTRDSQTGRVSQVVRQGVLFGQTVTETQTITRDENGRVVSATFLSEVNGLQDLTWTETYTRDGNHRVTSSALS